MDEEGKKIHRFVDGVTSWNIFYFILFFFFSFSRENAQKRDVKFDEKNLLKSEI